MHLQEVFDAVYKGLLEQGAQSVPEDGVGCAYRGEAGLCCAIGLLIDTETANEWDNFYDQSVSYDQSISTIIAFSAGELEGERKLKRPAPGWMRGPAMRSLLKDLQSAHDNADRYDFLPTFKSLMADVAEKHGLFIPEEV